MTASTAVSAIVLNVDAFTRAVGLSGNAGDSALSAGANLSGGAHGSTGATVFVVALQVDA